MADWKSYRKFRSLLVGIIYLSELGEIYRTGRSKRVMKWPDKTTTSYDMLDFNSYIKSLTRKYLVIGRHMLQIQGIL